MPNPNSSSRAFPVRDRIQKFPTPVRAHLRFREAVPEFMALLTAQTHVSLDRFDGACFSRWVERWHQTPLSQVTPDDLRSYFSELESQGTSRQNLEREKRLFRNFFRLARRRGTCDRDPTERLGPCAPPAPTACVALTDEEERRLLDACRGVFPPGTPSTDSLRRPPVPPAYMHGLVLLGLRTGLRFNHLLGLEWRNVDLKKDRITVPAQETWQGHDIEVAIDGETMPALLDLLRSAQGAPVMPARVFDAAGLPLWRDRPDDFAVLQVLTRLLKTALVPGNDFEVLRLTFARRCAERGIPLLLPVRVGDWEDATPVLEIYTRVEMARYAGAQ